MRSFLLDTNSLLRFLLNDIPDQASKVAEVLAEAKLKKIKLFVPQIVIFELFFALDKYYDLPKDQAINKIEVILASPYLDVEECKTFKEALYLFKTKNIDFVDCFLISKAEDIEASIYTFDQELKKLSSR